MPDIGHSAFLQSLGWALINSLWQLALLWVVYQVIFSLRTQATPQVKSATATLLLCTGFGWFLFTFVDHLLAGSPATVLNGVVQSFTSYNGLNDLVNTVLPIASVTYLLLLFIPLVRFARNYRFVNQLRSQGIKKIDVEWRLFVNRIAQQLGIKKPVHIYISDLVTSPVTIGYLKPLILVPVAAVNRLSTSQVEAILLHELAHIKRHDYLVNLVITFIHTILYFNPFVRLFIKNIEREREKSCE